MRPCQSARLCLEYREGYGGRTRRPRPLVSLARQPLCIDLSLASAIGCAMSENNPWTPEWSNAVFPLEERDRRWAKVRKLMARDGIDLIICLPNTHNYDRAQADSRYLTQLGENGDETTVAFPVEGKVTAWLSRGGIWPGSNWLADIRPQVRGGGGATITSWLNENPGYQKATIAI